MLGRQVPLSPRTSSGGLPSPCASPAEPQWPSRVAETAPTASLSDAAAATAAPAVETAAKASAAPRMADAILQVCWNDLGMAGK